MLQVTFAEVVRVLEGFGSSVPAAEAHGCLVGALCTVAHYPIERWLEEIIPDLQSAAEEDGSQALRLLYADTLNALRGEDMEFEVLLPDDDSPLAARAGGLAQWCQGFLYGFGTGTVADADQRDELPGNVNEILNDFTQICRASLELDEQGSESEEEAYAEVVEYVRVGVQLIHDELVPAAPRRIDMGAAADADLHDFGASDASDDETPGGDDPDRDPTLH